MPLDELCWVAPQKYKYKRNDEELSRKIILKHEIAFLSRRHNKSAMNIELSLYSSPVKKSKLERKEKVSLNQDFRGKLKIKFLIKVDS